MRFFAPLVAALATLAAAADYTQPDYSKPPSGNAILAPGLNEQVPVGKPFTITWEPTTQGPISLVLLRGPSENVVPLETLAVGIPNSGKFVWTPGSQLENDVTHYGLLLVVEGTGQYQWSTQFGISNPGATKPTTTGPAPTGPAQSTQYVTEGVTTTICPETETTAPVAPTTIPVDVPTTIPVVVPTSTAVVPSTFASSVAVPSTVPSTTSTPPSPAFTGAAGRNVLSLGAVAAGVAAVLAF
ncbi:hypothetical protein FE257_009626 [Aspergillus nanangensis]|uniref:Yeast cell wall synthesis Kre9/Knh1-like N-terminal domain-containing protein n=1 Tax=Aspergillus nanangensis TaxID=2582783 RepID=A0AAD4CJT3_ASPNN|nr:hypothetical protein FE257_009626 [Aspergillus nanangensis]